MTGFTAQFYVENNETDYTSMEVQRTMSDFNDKLQRCHGCEKTWTEKNTLNSWYSSFYYWVDQGGCFIIREGISQDLNDYIEPDAFYPCLFEWLSDEGETFETNIRFSNVTNPMDRKIVGYRLTIGMKLIEEVSTDGVQLLVDVRNIEDKYGVPGTFSYAREYLDYEQYFTFTEETVLTTGCSIAAILVVVLIITASVTATLLVCLCVLLVDLFLCGLMHYWGLTFNSIVVVNVVIAVGLSVDYSAHIAHTYLIVAAPKTCTTNAEKRKYKASKALSQMGSSVFHGGFSTLLAIAVLGPSKTYIFEVFFKMWFGIIVFGMANGFLLLPVLLSYFGPVAQVMEPVSFKPEDDDGSCCCGCCPSKKK